jgi:sterol desaturase/sphingolipid hydroxylase (fatty acid hydroxylase superfamily)
MEKSYIQLAIPVFFLLIGVELVAARLLERDAYRFSDSLNDLSCGILQQLLEVFLKTALFAGYAWLFAAHRVCEIPAAAAWAWLACFLGVDFCYYWFHRWSHEVNAGWAAHVVHHQSEEYNLSVALRQGAFQPAFSWLFYLPLALVGFPPAMFLAVSSFNTLYQFWIHTRLVGRLGPLEWLLNTPSHHRVHHARNPKYVDRNHGGTLVQFVIVNAAAIAYLQASAHLGAWPKTAGAATILVSLLSLGGLLDRRGWAAALEALRLAVVALGLGLLLRPGVTASSMLLLAAASLAWLRSAVARSAASPRAAALRQRSA